MAAPAGRRRRGWRARCSTPMHSGWASPRCDPWRADPAWMGGGCPRSDCVTRGLLLAATVYPRMVERHPVGRAVGLEPAVDAIGDARLQGFRRQALDLPDQILRLRDGIDPQQCAGGRRNPGRGLRQAAGEWLPVHLQFEIQRLARQVEIDRVAHAHSPVKTLFEETETI